MPRTRTFVILSVLVVWPAVGSTIEGSTDSSPSESTAKNDAAWVAPLKEAEWVSHHDWLDNPAPVGSYSVVQRQESTTFSVERVGTGMKWSWLLPEPTTLQDRRFVSARYRATGWRPWSDYAVCVMGNVSTPNGFGYDALIPTSELIADGRWHTLNIDIQQIAQRFPTVSQLAVQLQAAGPNASLELADIRLDDKPLERKLSDEVNWRSDAAFDAHHPVNITPQTNGTSSSWREQLDLGRWFPSTDVTVDGVPFRLVAAEQDLAVTTIDQKQMIHFPVNARTNEVEMLLSAIMTGQEEPAYGLGRLVQLRDVDRFRISVTYADGTVDECLPMNVITGHHGVTNGVQVVAVETDISKEISTVGLHDSCRQAGFAVAAITVRTSGPQTTPQKPHTQAGPQQNPCNIFSNITATESARQLKARFSQEQPFVVRELHHLPSEWPLLSKPCSLIELNVNGQDISDDQLTPSHAYNTDEFVCFDIQRADRLRVGIRVYLVGAERLRITVAMRNDGDEEYTVHLKAPILGPYRLCTHSEQSFYLVPRRGTVLNNEPCSFNERYCGTFPVQFLDTFAPSTGRGISLRTEDTSCRRKHYLLSKSEDGFTVGVEYPNLVLGPGDKFQTAPAVITATDGNCRRGLDAYREWLKTWHRPLSPRKAWFREVFNFRQRFLWVFDPVYDSKSGELKLQQAVDEATREFGGIDYLHLFDWGNRSPYGRIYGRTGDYSPYPMIKGGRTTLHDAIQQVQSHGVRVGLYIEGYLLQERGKLGQQFGKDWQLVGRNGEGLYWPASSEMFICPAVEAWRQVQATTYATKVDELDVDGMYIDQFGFANIDKDCYSRDHGHPVPSYAVNTERECTRIIRESIEQTKPNVATYTEETPVDVTTQYQDGSFSYAMFSSKRTKSMVPLNIARFAIPDFKTIQILFCDKPTGSWATGVRWVFFNGEAIWLEGKAIEWFEPETRQEIRRCYAILHEHRDAFTTLNPEPLVPTEHRDLFANRFPVPGKCLFTLYNSSPKTVRGPILRLPHRDDVEYFDAWHKQNATVSRDSDFDIIHSEIGPHGVGCIVILDTNKSNLEEFE